MDVDIVTLCAPVLELLGMFDVEAVVDSLEETDEDGLQDANPEYVTNILRLGEAVNGFVEEYVL